MIPKKSRKNRARGRAKQFHNSAVLLIAHLIFSVNYSSEAEKYVVKFNTFPESIPVVAKICFEGGFVNEVALL